MIGFQVKCEFMEQLKLELTDGKLYLMYTLKTPFITKSYFIWSLE